MRKVTFVAAAMISGVLALSAQAGAHLSAEQYLDALLETCGKGDVEGMVTAHAEDAVFLTPMGVFNGQDEIRGLVGAVMEEFSKPGMSFEIIYKSGAGSAALLIWRGETADNVYAFAAETYIFNDEGKITEHTFAADVTPKIGRPDRA